MVRKEVRCPPHPRELYDFLHLPHTPQQCLLRNEEYYRTSRTSQSRQRARFLSATTDLSYRTDSVNPVT